MSVRGCEEKDQWQSASTTTARCYIIVAYSNWTATPIRIAVVIADVSLTGEVEAGVDRRTLIEASSSVEFQETRLDNKGQTSGNWNWHLPVKSILPLGNNETRLTFARAVAQTLQFSLADRLLRLRARPSMYSCATLKGAVLFRFLCRCSFVSFIHSLCLYYDM